MKLLTIIILSMIVTSALGDKDFDDFKKKFKVNFKDSKHEARAMKNYKDNKARRDQHNKDPSQSYKMDDNKFAIYDFDELSEMFLNNLIDENDVPDELKIKSTPYDEKDEEEDFVRKHGPMGKREKRQTVTAPKYPINAYTSLNVPAAMDYSYLFNAPWSQDQCGSCWAFATSGYLESILKYKNGFNQYLSPQYMVDCDPQELQCNGGWPHRVLAWMQNTAPNKNVAPLLTSYPYTATVGACKTSWQNATLGITAVSMLTSMTENALKLRLANYGPQIISLTVSQNFFSYGSGVFKDTATNCFSNNCMKINHAVVLVGYGSDPVYGLFWKIRNSWGPEWGEQGYIRIARNSGCMCNVNCYVTYATMKMT